ncbi:hypothetical protein KPL78_26325 [Roseomonas sp. HJA6]|uniref:Uncharacterized protein n=1 Tax=Roseomonas alba TaxID=2846776 RepID=A0ABS7AGL2_9PROT|nr:hypothetical protein [Neoroseomonas alba]MBW6401396.1 hypothetical protein [Neoroseomonas alba]
MLDDEAGGHSFRPELPGAAAQQISIKAAQPKLALNILKDHPPGGTAMVGVLDLGASEVETSEVVAQRIRAVAKLKPLADGAAIVRKELGHTA